MNTSFNIAALFFEAAEKYPGVTALVEGESKITYQQLGEDVLKTITYYQRKGLKKGDRCLVFVPMGIEGYHAYV